MAAKVASVHIFISGRVQGVSFRWWVVRAAQDLRLVGWVKNLDDGRVEAVFEGEEEDVKKMIDVCKKGPMFAKVKHLEATKEDATGEFDGFEILF